MVEKVAPEQGDLSKGDSKYGDSTPLERKPLSRSGGLRPMFRSAEQHFEGVISPCSLPPSPCLFVESISYRVAAYITAYQEIEALDKTVTAIQKQSYPVEQIFIVDNSKTQVVTENRYHQTIVDFHPENLGVAGGLKIAIKWAIEKGYDFLWLFDQDSEPNLDVLDKLLRKYQQLSEKGKKIGIIAPTIIDINTKQEFPGSIFQKYKLVPISGSLEIKDFYQCDCVITSGSLVNISAAKCVELPREDLFLDAVDYAYCINFKNQGYEIIVVKNTMMKHRLGNYSKVKDRLGVCLSNFDGFVVRTLVLVFLRTLVLTTKKSSQTKQSSCGGQLVKGNNEVTTFICSPSRYYYACRNHTFFETRTSNKAMLYRSVIYRIKLLIHMITRVIRYEPDLVLLKVWACILGTFDGFRGKLGKNW